MTEVARLNVFLGLQAEELRNGLDRAAKQMEAAGKRMQAVGRTMTTYVTLPLAAVGAASVKMASDAEEAANKFDVVMGDSAESVRARLQELTATIPMTRSEMETLAAGIQDMLVPMGLARDEAANMSADMVQLAGDIASFNNVDPSEALNAVRSALAGESEPMRRFGVDTRVARLEVLALEAGLIKAGEALDNTARAQAVMLAIQADSADAMGDAARTVDSTANAMKFFARDVRQLSITIGEILIPAVTPLIQKLSAALQWLQGLDPATQKVVVAVAALAAAAGPLLLVLGTIVTLAPGIVTAFTVLTGPVGLAVVAFGALVAAGVAIVDNWRVIEYEVTRLVDGIRDALVGRFNAIVDSVREKVAAVTGFFRDMYMAVVGGSFVPDMIDGIREQFSRLDSVMVDRARWATEEVGLAFEGLAVGGANAFADFATGAGGAISQFVTQALRDLARLFAQMLLFRALASLFGGPTVGRITSSVAGSASSIGAAALGASTVGIPTGASSVGLTPAMAGAPVMLNVSLPPARTPFDTARDSQWLKALRLSLRELGVS